MNTLESDQSNFTLAFLTTAPHLTDSAARKRAKSAGPTVTGSAPFFSMVKRTSGRASALTISWFNRLTMARASWGIKKPVVA